MEREPQTHDYTRRYWGHDYMIREVRRGGKQVLATGWGRDIHEGDYLIFPQGGDKTTRYKVMGISYFRDPDDMWNASLDFAPREP